MHVVLLLWLKLIKWSVIINKEVGRTAYFSWTVIFRFSVKNKYNIIHPSLTCATRSTPHSEALIPPEWANVRKPNKQPKHCQTLTAFNNSFRTKCFGSRFEVNHKQCSAIIQYCYNFWYYLSNLDTLLDNGHFIAYLFFVSR